MMLKIRRFSQMQQTKITFILLFRDSLKDDILGDLDGKS
jgi:hypothetical protein